jgi:hypothetical protein
VNYQDWIENEAQQANYQQWKDRLERFAPAHMERTRMLSTHKVEVVPVKLDNHPNADSLSVVSVFGGYPCCVRTCDWKDGDLAAYIPPDSVVDVTLPEFAFLAKGTKTSHRVRCVKLRGVQSYGLLMKAPEGANVGDDVAEHFGVQHYEPEMRGACTGGEAESAPDRLAHLSRYDVDSMRRYAEIFQPGEEVCVTEKIHGCVPFNALISMADGSRKRISMVQVGDEVLGVLPGGQVTSTKVIRRYHNGPADEGWLKITGQRRAAGRGSSYFALRCTPDHEVFVNGSYLRADRIRPGDKLSLVRSEFGLTPVQTQVLTGKLLGDGSLFGNEWSAHVAWSHSANDLGYIEWTARAIGDLDTGVRESMTSGYGSEMIRSRTPNRACIKQKFDAFYSADRIKVVPKWIADELTPLALAFWYMDDGALEHNEGQEDRAVLATNGFTQEDCDVLIRGLRKLGVAATMLESNGWRIVVDSDNSERLFLLVAPYIPMSMQRKLPERYRGGFGWLPSLESQYKPMLVEQVVETVEPDTSLRSQRFDMETETHNYFANGVLVHNCNSRYCFWDGRMWCGSRSEWKRQEPDSLWWRALTPEMEAFCMACPGVVLYGEVYGNVQCLKYGLGNGVTFAAFDVLNLDGTFVDASETRLLLADNFVKQVPLVGCVPFDFDTICALAEGPSLVPGADHIREGVVVKPMVERFHQAVGRVILKVVGAGYLEKT